MTETIKGALIGALIPTIGSFAIFFLGNFHTEDVMEKQYVTILSESFETVDESMTFEESVQNIRVYV